MVKKNSHVIVPKRHPVLEKAAYFLAFATVLALLWLSFDLGRDRAGFDSDTAAVKKALLSSKIDELQQGNTDLRNQNAILVQAAIIDKEAYSEVEKGLVSVQDEILELQQTVAFYEGIVSPSERSKGLRIKDIVLKKNSDGTTFHYDLVLMLFHNKNRRISGASYLTFIGMQGDKKIELKHRNIVLGPKKSMPFRFKFFQRMEGDVALPKGFVPLQLKVKVVPEGRRLAPIEMTYDWEKILS